MHSRKIRDNTQSWEAITEKYEPTLGFVGKDPLDILLHMEAKNKLQFFDLFYPKTASFTIIKRKQK